MNTRIQRLEESIKSLRKQINEVLASPYPYNITPLQVRKREYGMPVGAVQARFKSGDSEYVYTMFLNFLESVNEVFVTADVVFFDEEGRIELTGKGDAFRIMATVIEITKKILNTPAIVRKFVREADLEIEKEPIIDILKFSAKPEERGRVKLYSRFAKQTPGFTFLKHEDDDFVLVNDKLDSKQKAIIARSI